MGEMNPYQCEIVADFYDATVEPELWSETLERFAHAIQADACVLMRRHFLKREGAIVDAFGLDGPVKGAYTDRVAADDVWAQDDAFFQTASVFSGTDAVDEGALTGSGTYHDWLAHQKLQHALFLVLERRGDTAHYVIAFRSAEAPAFSSEEIGVVRDLSPRVAAAFRLGGGVARQKAERAIAFEALDAMPIGIIAVDRSGAVVRANRFAHAVIAGGEGVLNSDVGLVLDRPGHRIKVRDLIAQLEGSRTQSAISEPVSYTLPRYRQQRPLTCLLITPGKGKNATPDGGPAALLFIGDPERPMAFDATR
ncbi:MAG: hypothetical protein HC834_02880, partial [Rhodospirillales bacterium]|nr:hypothetical protein [Rhodospirillales bacterium]